jgi:hypothetical protein
MFATEFQRKMDGKMENTTFEHAKEVVQALSPEDKQRLRQWLEEEQRENGCAASSEPQSTPDFEREQRRLSEHQREYVDNRISPPQSGA